MNTIFYYIFLSVSLLSLSLSLISLPFPFPFYLFLYLSLIFSLPLSLSSLFLIYFHVSFLLSLFSYFSLSKPTEICSTKSKQNQIRFVFHSLFTFCSLQHFTDFTRLTQIQFGILNRMELPRVKMLGREKSK